MHKENNKEPLDGVKCIVNTCHYHLMGDQCGHIRLKFNQGMHLLLKKPTVLPLDLMISWNRIGRVPVYSIPSSIESSFKSSGMSSNIYSTLI